MQTFGNYESTETTTITEVTKRNFRLRKAPARELIGLSYSPYTEKAKWVLDHHKTKYKYTEHLIMLDMFALRRRTGRPSSEITVPLLLEDKSNIFDSFAIAQHVDHIATGKTMSLFPLGRLAEIKEYNDLSESILNVGRALVVQSMAKNRQARKDSLPPFVPKILRGAALPLVNAGLTYIKKSFNVENKSAEQYEAELHILYSIIEQRLQRAGGTYLLGSFSYADIAIAVTLQFIAPVDDTYIPLTPALRECWSHGRLMHRFSNLIKWRDDLYKKHREPQI